MSQLAESFAWCAVQVTLFSIVASGIYSVVRRLRIGGAAMMLVASLAIVELLTLMSFSPWPRWISPQLRETRNKVAASGQTLLDFHKKQVDIATERANISAPPALSAETDTPPDKIDAIPRVIATNTPPRTSPLFVFFVVAALAAAIGLLRLIAGIAWLWHFYRTGVVIDDGPLNELAAALSQQIGVQRSVQLRESASLGVAATAGWRRPYVLLPSIWRSWNADERRAVLAHELAHIKQRHFPAWMLSQLPLVAHYYHPLVHWLARRLRFEQEVAADQLAAQVFGERRHYASILAGLALGASPAPRGLFAILGLFMSRPFLMRRIAMLRQATEINGRSTRSNRLLILLVLMLAAVAVAGLRTSRAENADEPKVTTSSDATNPRSSPDVSAAPDAPKAPDAGSPELLSGAPPAASKVAEQLAFEGGTAAVALFEVSRTTPSVAGLNLETESDAGWEILCKTQLAKLKSYFVLNAALRKPGIAALPLIRSQADPVAWLAKSLDVGFVPGSEILYVGLHGKSGEHEQLIQIVNAVAKAYEEEVVYDGKSRQLSTRDLLAKSLEALNKKIEEGMALYLSMAKEMGKVESGREQVAQDIDIRRLDRIDAELMRLEDEFLSAKIYHEQQQGEVDPRERAKLQFYEQRIAQLQKRQTELGEQISARSERSVDLSMQKSNLDRLQKVYDELSLRLQMLDVDASAPPRIRLIQQAVPSGVPETQGADGKP